ncbi:MAG TPA: LCP family protein [Candidatus Fimimorpha faecalis]|uniref:LCP family protein n=1 Tax=Candidatus Fimimorpha faecalis TaxID=2840824 RepID=A0A9D1JE84_9FIRM|nr:LCP family protein [Candidatus Fimimorpha faecalis]
MAKLTDEEIRILQRARMIQDRLEAERLEAGEELPAKKPQPKIQRQKINKTKTSQNQMGRTTTQKKTEGSAQKPVSSETAATVSKAVASKSAQAAATAKFASNLESSGKTTPKIQEGEKKLLNQGQVKEVENFENSTGIKHTVRQPVATVEEKRNKNLAAGPVRKPVATIDTIGRRKVNQSSEKAVEESAKRQIKNDTQQRSIQIEKDKAKQKKSQAPTQTNTQKTRSASLKQTVTPRGTKQTSSKRNSSSTVRRKPLKKKKTAKWKIVLIALVITFLLAAIAAVGAFILIYSNVSRTNYEPIAQSERSADVLAEQKGVKNILLLGTDERVSGEASRSDAIIVLSINENRKKIVMTSILRDSYVEIPGYGKNRINHAYQMGGAALMIQTIENNFKIPIDSYAKVDFFSFMGIIDKLGGVPITVTQEELGYLNGYIAEINTLQGLPVNDGQLAQAGNYQLNGKQALAYSRIRYIGTDFARTERQRTVLDGLFQQLKTASPKELYEISAIILPDITTNIGNMDLTKMIAKSVFYMKYDIIQNRIPMDGTWNDLVVGGQEVLEIDFEANREGLKSMIYGE